MNCDEIGGNDSREAERSLLEAEIVRLKEAVVRQKEEFEAAIGEMKVKGAVLERLYGEGAKNPKLLLKLIDVSKIGFDEQI
ncbi:MAG: phage scaffolding protein, partial [Ruminiclostridium sp.]|nr:phage scaffolding protein [Ruminiclostridium sp.]